MQPKKRCADCRKLKWAEDFGRGSAWKDGRYPYCRACVSRRAKAKRAEDPDKQRTYMREYMRRQRLRGQAEGRRLRELYLSRSFWLRVQVGALDQCWTWTGATTTEGYGVLRRDAKSWPAHRMSWLLSYGVAPRGVIMHKCDNRACCNPLHLQDGTQLENTIDMLSKGRAHCFGYGAKTTPEMVREVRRLKREGVVQLRIAERLGMHQTTVSQILSGKRWSHVPDT